MNDRCERDRQLRSLCSKHVDRAEKLYVRLLLEDGDMWRSTLDIFYQNNGSDSGHQTSSRPTIMLKLTRALTFPFVRYAATAASPSSSSAPRYSALGMKAAEEVSSKWRGTTANGGRTKNYIGGEFTESQTDKWLEVRDPVCRGAPIYRPRLMKVRVQSTQTIVNYVPETTEGEFNAAVDAASQAFKTWSEFSIIKRQRVVFE